MHHGDDFRLREQDSVRVAQGHARVDQLLAADDHSLGGQAGFLADAERPPRVRPPELVRALHMHDRDVRLHRAHLDQVAGHRQAGIRAQDIAAQQGSRGQARHVPRRGPEREGDGEVRVVVDLERTWDPVLARSPVAVAETLGHVADPGGGDAAHAPGADELVEQGIRDGPDQLEVPPALPDHLVPGGEGDERLEGGAHCHGGAIGHVSLDGLPHRHDFAGHRLKVTGVGRCAFTRLR